MKVHLNKAVGKTVVAIDDHCITFTDGSRVAVTPRSQWQGDRYNGKSSTYHVLDWENTTTADEERQKADDDRKRAEELASLERAKQEQQEQSAKKLVALSKLTPEEIALLGL